MHIYSRNAKEYEIDGWLEREPRVKDKGTQLISDMDDGSNEVYVRIDGRGLA